MKLNEFLIYKELTKSYRFLDRRCRVQRNLDSSLQELNKPRWEMDTQNSGYFRP